MLGASTRPIIHFARLNAAGQSSLSANFPISRLAFGVFVTRQNFRGIRMASMDDTPISINDRLYRTVREGQANILAPYRSENNKGKPTQTQPGQPRNNDEGDQAVFYNPIQQYNRDLSVLAILVYGENAMKVKNSRRSNNAQKGKRQRADKLRRTQAVNSTSKKRTAEEAGLEANGYEGDESSKKTRNLLTEPTNKSENLNQVDEESVPQQTHSIEKAAQGFSASNATNAATQNRPPRPNPFTILDALSASGLRAIRYAKEIPFATTVIANDLLPEAVDAINLNIEHNELKEKVFSNVGDARQFMYSKTGDAAADQGPSYVHKFDVVDLDPYGTAAPFLDAAIQAVTDGGMLCVTCTDAGVFASNGYPEKAFALYGGIPLKGPHSHEAGLRLILHSIAISAAKYGIAIEPLLSLSIDFYARVFIRVHKSQQDVKLLAGTAMLVYNCDIGCGAWEIQPLARNQKREAKDGQMVFHHGFAQGPSTDRNCQHCGAKTHLGGPMWGGPLHNPQFIRKILEKLETADKTVYGTVDRMKGMLTVALEEENIEWSATIKSSKKQNTTDQEKDGSTSSGADLIARLPSSLISSTPLFFLPTYLAKVLSLPTPAEDPLRGAFLALGYHCTRSHCKPGSFKTNAPWKVIWEVMREWARQKEPDRIPRLLGEGDYQDKGSVKKSSSGWQILKRLKGRKDDSLLVARMRETWLKKLGLGHGSTDFQTVSDLQDAFKSALYELEHPSHKPETTDSHGTSLIVQSDTNGHAAMPNGPNTEELPTSNGTSDDGPPLVVNNRTQPAKISGKALIDDGGDVSDLDVVFNAQLGRAFRESKGGKLVRYQINPRANWGPMVRAGTGSG